MSKPHAWSFLTIEGPRQYGGNEGYEDSTAEVYHYDSDVANYRQVAVGDIAIIRSSDHVLGVATIEKIEQGEGPKERLRCPVCSVTNIKRRTTVKPEWRCIHGHSFGNPLREWDTVIKFEAHYGSSFRPPPAALTLTHLREAVIRPSDQMSIKAIDLAKLEPQLRSEPLLRRLLANYARRMTPPDPHDDQAAVEGSVIEERRRVLRQIALRRGQARFRRRLIDRYGCACQISRCSFPGLVEAAHVRPYARTSDNGARNGLLLRTDLHTLFDLGLLGIRPDTLAVLFHPEVLAAGYGVFNEASLYVNGTSGPDREALDERWVLFMDGKLDASTAGGT
jgi:putative restriction endonuclease